MMGGHVGVARVEGYELRAQGRTGVGGHEAEETPVL